jgi:catechol-2,3-dioxygenase
MTLAGLGANEAVEVERAGYAHLAVSVGSPAAVDALTARLRADGYPVLSGPRTTGDGYYESVVADPDGNRVEITVRREGTPQLHRLSLAQSHQTIAIMAAIGGVVKGGGRGGAG